MLLLVCIQTGQADNLPDHGGNRTRESRDLWDTSPMLFQLSYGIKSVGVGDILELSLVPSISMYSKI